MNVRYRVTLSELERKRLEDLVARGRTKVRDVKRAQILLAAAAAQCEGQIAAAVGTSLATIYRTKRCFVEEGMESALHDAPRPGGGRKLSGKEEALLIATACSEPPEGRARWTLDLLADRMVALTGHSDLSDETVRRRLAENELKPWQQKMWCVPTINSEYVARMEDVLDLYAEPADPTRPVLCFDESPTQLIGEVREPQPVAPGAPARVDYEYQRNGTANLFVVLDVHRGWRHVDVTEQRASYQFAHQMKALVDEHYPDAVRIRVVMDNLSTHSAAALYDTFEPAEARRILRKLEIHYVPKHASWLNMVEIEIGVLKRQCLDRRIADRESLVREIAAWEQARNAVGARIRWMFTTERAREKLGRVYRPLAKAREEAAHDVAA
ncbi:MAG: IS630 family transposase [Deltaproteobacteria bacterium]|nr:IS630 family transposase [Myxococcales bacterium]MDP3214821.1 IS630 family transposase [Deltaproteobacteria bacterium]